MQKARLCANKNFLVDTVNACQPNGLVGVLVRYLTEAPPEKMTPEDILTLIYVIISQFPVLMV